MFLFIATPVNETCFGKLLPKKPPLFYFPVRCSSLHGSRNPARKLNHLKENRRRDIRAINVHNSNDSIKVNPATRSVLPNWSREANLFVGQSLTECLLFVCFHRKVGSLYLDSRPGRLTWTKQMFVQVSPLMEQGQLLGGKNKTQREGKLKDHISCPDRTAVRTR